MPMVSSRLLIRLRNRPMETAQRPKKCALFVRIRWLITPLRLATTKLAISAVCGCEPFIRQRIAHIAE